MWSRWRAKCHQGWYISMSYEEQKGEGRANTREWWNPIHSKMRKTMKISGINRLLAQDG